MLSYARGVDRPLLEITLGRALESVAAQHPDELAVVVRHQEVWLTWSELLRRTDEVARGLAGLGLQPQDRIGGGILAGLLDPGIGDVAALVFVGILHTF